MEIRCLVKVVAVWFLLVVTAERTAHGGSGRIEADGTIDLTLSFRFPPSSDSLTAVRAQLTTASQLLFDATEGQLRLGDITITCSSVDEDLADYWVYAEEIRSNSPLDGLSVRGSHISQFFGNIGEVWAHEFGHLGFGLHDEYAEGDDQTRCNGRGFCIEETPAAQTAQNQCLMQQSPGVDWSELCTATNHEQIRGNNPMCLVNPPSANGAPCADGCAKWNMTTLRYEESSQESGNHESCWQTVTRKFPFIASPAALPQVAAPGGFVNPVFTSRCNPADTMLLVLDRSGSMSWNVNSDNGEVCGNGADDDGDGMIDETDDCAQARIEFVRAAARSFLSLAGTGTLRAGLISFNSMPRRDNGIVNVQPNIAALGGLIDGLIPGGETAIGEALADAKALLDADATVNGSKAVLLITDGVNTTGRAPTDPVADYVRDGVRIFTISTGDASNDETLTAVSNNTRGERLDSRNGTELVPAMVQMWARYTNEGVIVPKTPYQFDQKSARFPGPGQPILKAAIQTSPSLTFLVEDKTADFTTVLAGNLRDMRGFGVRAILRSPSGVVFDSEAAASPGAEVTRDRFFVMFRILNPEAGEWTLTGTSLPGVTPVQTGNAIIISRNPQTDLFVNADKSVVTAATDVVNLTLHPQYFTGLENVAWQASVAQPDGTTTPLTIEADKLRPFTYRAKVTGFQWSGLHTINVSMATNASTVNDPGEPRSGVPGKDTPPNTRPVPRLQRSATVSVFADVGRWPCANPPDCDGDGINENPTADSDGDGIPDPQDHDSDNDEISDATEGTGDPDGDNIPNYLDTDSDGDGVIDTFDRTPTEVRPVRCIKLCGLEIRLLWTAVVLLVILDFLVLLILIRLTRPNLRQAPAKIENG